jgi:hypothetical protein
MNDGTNKEMEGVKGCARAHLTFEDVEPPAQSRHWLRLPASAAVRQTTNKYRVPRMAHAARYYY